MKYKYILIINFTQLCITKIIKMATKANSINLERQSKKPININAEALIFSTFFIVGLVGSLSVGGLFLKEIIISGIIITAIMIFKDNAHSVRSKKNFNYYIIK
ncbi:MAG: hypothetical protein ACI86M_003884 [Saprospiraceae bacterium]|jgi:hypothetical protein